ncbi:MAG: T9SS type A sorting domain-containing protein [Bacteroidia bacterium]|nr:T9SS type A sorting domain-containing protein [Bacteroidia bacterium]
MLFTRYKTFVTIPGFGSANYVVTGALSNKGVTIAKIKGKKSSEVYGNITAPYSKNMSAIGWKFHNASPPIVVYDSLTYFVKTINSDIYKVVFTNIKGGTTGKIYFFEGNKSGIQNITSANKSIKAFPNPAIDHISVDIESANIGIYSMEGRLIRSVSEGENIFIGDLSNGIYSLRAIKGNSVYTGIFIKE